MVFSVAEIIDAVSASRDTRISKCVIEMQWEIQLNRRMVTEWSSESIVDFYFFEHRAGTARKLSSHSRRSSEGYLLVDA